MSDHRKAVEEGAAPQDRLASTAVRADLFGMPVDLGTPADHVAALAGMLDTTRPALVVTPNADHFMRWQRNDEFRALYERADRSIIDGAPLAWMGKLLGLPAAHRLAGVDAFLELCEFQDRSPLRVHVVGSDPDTCRAAAREMTRRFERCEIVGYDCPFGAELQQEATLVRVADNIRENRANLVAICLGSPKQELFFAQAHPHLPPAVYMGLGATVDFLAGKFSRAPSWLGRFGLEWVYRLALEPKRLARRYLVEDLPIVKYLTRAALMRITRTRGASASNSDRA